MGKPAGRDDEYTRGSPRRREVGPVGDRRIVYDANDVLRDIAHDVVDVKTQDEVASAMGYAQSTLNAFLKGRPGKLDVLTGLCAVLDSDPVDVLAEHPLFADSARSLVRPKDHLFKRFTAVLRNRNADRLVRALEVAKRAGKLDEITELVLRQVALLDDSNVAGGAKTPARKRKSTAKK